MTPPTAMTTPEVLQIKLSVQQRRDFTACAQMCGLELTAWIVQCADVKAADAIDAMQAAQRVERPSRKKQKPRLRSESPTVEMPAVERARSSGVGGTSRKNATLKAARSYNERFRRRFGASTKQRDEEVR